MRMVNSNNFKFIWWAILVISLGGYLYLRQEKLIAGSPTYFDVVVFLVWMSICLAPIFKDVKLFGLELKQDIEQLKKDISHQLAIMQVQLQSSIDISSSNTSHVHINNSAPIPATDSEILNLKQQISETLKEFGIAKANVEEQLLIFASDVPKESLDLFKIRFSFEKLINEFSPVFGIDSRRLPLHINLRELQKNGRVSSDIVRGVLEVIAICNYAIHTAQASKNQISFVIDTAPGLYTALKRELRENA